MHLTKNEIKADIQDFQDRILEAQAKLEKLPGGFLPITEHKQRETARSALVKDIKHYEQIIIYATEALDSY